MPTGVQDYRPALYGGIAALELERRRRPPRRARRRSARARAAHRARLHRRAAQLGHEQLGDHQAAHRRRPRTSSTASSASATRRRRCATALERGDWDEVGRQIADRVGQPQAPGARRHDAGDRRPDRARDGRRRDGRQGVRRRRRRLPLLLRSADGARRRSPRRSAAAARGCSTTASRRKACGLDNLGDRAHPPGDRRSARDQGRQPLQDSRVPQRRRHRRQPSARSSRRSTTPALREIPGIGKDLAARIRELAETGDAAYHRELLAEFPPTILDLLRLQGVGPKTVAMLYRELGIRTLDDLERAARDGRLRALQGMGAKKEALILKALEERKRHAGRHLLPDAHDAAAALVALPPRARAGRDDRRRSAACGAAARPAATSTSSRRARDGVADGRRSSSYPLVERVLGRGDTKSSVLLRGGFQADLRLVPPRAAAPRCSTSPARRPTTSRCATARSASGFKLNEYGLFRVDDDETRRRARPRKASTRRSAWRGCRPSCARTAARSRRPRPARCRAWSTAPTCAATCTCTPPRPTARTTSRRWPRPRARRGLEYIAITDHSQVAGDGQRPRRAARARARRPHPRARRTVDGIRLLAGIECDILPDGSLDLADDCLAAARPRRRLGPLGLQPGQPADDRPPAARARESRGSTSSAIRPAACFCSASRIRSTSTRCSTRPRAHGVALEINCQVDRLDLNDVHARLARDRGVPLVISTDAHSTAALRQDLRWGVLVARRAWLEPDARAQHAAVRGVQGTPAPEPSHDDADQDAAPPTTSWPRSAASTSRRRRQTIQEDLAKALDLLKSMNSEEERERATVYMEGLAEMYKDWIRQEKRKKSKRHP